MGCVSVSLFCFCVFEVHDVEKGNRVVLLVGFVEYGVGFFFLDFLDIREYGLFYSFYMFFFDFVDCDKGFHSSLRM